MVRVHEVVSSNLTAPTIFFWGASILATAWRDYVDDGGSPTGYSVGWQPKENIWELIEAKPTKTGYADSDINSLTIKFKRVGNTDPAF